MTESLLKILNFFIPNTLFHLAIICVFLLCVFNPYEIANPLLLSNFLKEYGIFFLVFPIFSFFFVLFKIGQKIIGLYKNKRARDFLEEKQEKCLVHRIKEVHYKIANEFYRCMCNDTNKIRRTEELDHLISICKFRFCFDLEEDHYIVKQDIFRIIKKHHQEIFENRYWNKTYERLYR